MKPQLILLLLILSIPSLFSQTTNNEPLILVKAGEKEGYINFDGQEVIPVEFDAVRWFSEDMLPVNKGAIEEAYKPVGGKWGFWHRSGKEIIPLQFEDAKIFREGLAPVKLNGKYGFINLKGEVQIDFQFEDAQPFKEDFAAVQLNGKWGFINKKGELVIAPAYHRVKDFQNGFSVVFHLITEFEYEDDGYVYMEEDGKYGLIDEKGILKLDTIYDYIDRFVNGFARVELERKEGFVNSKGEISIPIQFDKTENFSEGLAVVGNYMMRDSYHDFGYSQGEIDSLTKEVEKLYNKYSYDIKTLMNHPTYQEFQTAKMQEPSEQLMHGYINEQGEVVIDFQYDQADAFKNNLAKVRFGQETMIRIIEVDENGNEMPSYAEKIGIGTNLIDTTGKLLLSQNQTSINRCDDKILVTYNYLGAGAQYENLKEIITPQFRNLSYLGDGYFVGEIKNSKNKVLLGNGVELELDEHFWRLEKANGNRILVDFVIDKKGNRTITKSGIINEKGEWILKPKYDFSMVEFRGE